VCLITLCALINSFVEVSHIACLGDFYGPYIYSCSLTPPISLIFRLKFLIRFINRSWSLQNHFYASLCSSLEKGQLYIFRVGSGQVCSAYILNTACWSSDHKMSINISFFMFTSFLKIERVSCWALVLLNVVGILTFVANHFFLWLPESKK